MNLVHYYALTSYSALSHFVVFLTRCGDGISERSDRGAQMIVSVSLGQSWTFPTEKHMLQRIRKSRFPKC